MVISNETIHQIELTCLNDPDLNLPFFKVRAVKRVEDDCYLFLKTMEKSSPDLIVATGCQNGKPTRIIPHFMVRERPDRQIVSYSLGKDFCNLTETREICGRLYSRYAGSYRTEELPHQDGAHARIGLWVHDCLTEDFDHGVSVNRYHLPDGSVISYDFGMAFSRSYFPPFYTFELGIRDASIIENKPFVLKQLVYYAHRAIESETFFIERIKKLYPTTHREALCRYYFRNFQTYFPKRLFFSQVFKKLQHTRFEKEILEELSDLMRVPMAADEDWHTFSRKLSDLPSLKLDLKGLDLSGADLRRADLRGADLQDANLEGADLEKANLRDANLRGTNLTSTNLKGAILNDSRRIGKCRNT